MRTRSVLLKLLCLAVLLCAGTASRAAITVYTNETAFLAAVAAPGVDSFDDLAVGALGDSLVRDAGAYGYTASAAYGLWGAGGGGDGWLSTNLRGDAIVFSGFGAGVDAFGGNFFGTNIGGAYVPGGSLVLTASDGISLIYTLTGATGSAFVGVVADGGLRSVTLRSPDGAADWPTANDVVLAVPEPAAPAMFLAGLGLLGLLAARRRR